MKSKEYVKQFISECEGMTEINRETIGKQMKWLANTFMSDFESMKQSRNIGVGSRKQSLVNLVNDYHKKWINVAYGINLHFTGKFNMSLIKNSGFLEILKITDKQYI